MSSLFSVYLLATAVQLYVQGTKFGLFCYFYVNFIDSSEVMLLVVVVDKSIIQRTICNIIRPRVSIVEQFDQVDERSFEKSSNFVLSFSSLCCFLLSGEDNKIKDSLFNNKKISINKRSQKSLSYNVQRCLYVYAASFIYR